MSTRKHNPVTIALVLLVAVTLLAGCSLPGAQSGPTAAEFYKGKTMTMIITSNPGGGFDQYARLVAPALEKSLGATVVPENQGSAGGMAGSNAIYRAAGDGLTIGLINVGGLIFASVTDQPGVQYDMTKYTWLGRVNAESRVLLVSGKGNIKSVDDLKKLGRTILVAQDGAGSDDYYLALGLFKGLELPIKIVAGYAGAEQMAILRGEVDAMVGTPSSARANLEAGELRAILAMSDTPITGYETVPLAKNVASASGAAFVTATAKVTELERSFVGPPGIPADRVAFLRDAFNKAYADPAVLELYTKAKRAVSWLDGATCEQRIPGIMTGALSLKATLKAAMAQ